MLRYSKKSSPGVARRSMRRRFCRGSRGEDQRKFVVIDVEPGDYEVDDRTKMT